MININITINMKILVKMIIIISLIRKLFHKNSFYEFASKIL